MTRITLAIATVLSLGFTPLAAQETNCDGWMSSDAADGFASGEVIRQFWGAVTVDTVSGCLNAGADVNAKSGNESTPLHYAAGADENPDVLSIIAALLEGGADINARNSGGVTPLHWGAGKPEVLTLLLGAGANVNNRSEDGSTPLRSAGWHDNPQSIKVLLDARSRHQCED